MPGFTVVNGPDVLPGINLHCCLDVPSSGLALLGTSLLGTLMLCRQLDEAHMHNEHLTLTRSNTCTSQQRGSKGERVTLVRSCRRRLDNVAFGFRSGRLVELCCPVDVCTLCAIQTISGCCREIVSQLGCTGQLVAARGPPALQSVLLRI